jgi:hypothetical protein
MRVLVQRVNVYPVQAQRFRGNFERLRTFGSVRAVECRDLFAARRKDQ